MVVYFFAFLVFLISCLGSYVAFLGSKSNKMEFFSCFSRGVFFGLAVIHFLPEAFEYAYIAKIDSVYIMIVAALFYYFLQFLTKVIITHRIKYKCSPSHWCLSLVFVLLMLHCIVEGGALVFSNSFIIMLFTVLGVCLHKASVAFAITNSFISVKIEKNLMRCLLLGFLLSTPLSMMFFKAGVGFVFNNEFLCWTQVVAFSTFLYVAINHHLCYTVSECSRCDFKDILWFGYGLLTIVLVSLLN